MNLEPPVNAKTAEDKLPLVIAQFSDSHLFSDPFALHHSANVYQHLQQVLADIAQQPKLDAIIFTGDLTQDHSTQSYQNFAQLVAQAKLPVPVYYLAGNHDEPSLMAEHFEHSCFQQSFNSEKTITLGHWQIQLLDSKSATPAGIVDQQSFQQLKENIDSGKYQLLMMHHHPVDIGYFIDRHGLTNQTQFWQTINELQQQGIAIQAIASGHVHNARFFAKHSQHPQQSVDVYTCPATSIAFDPTQDTVSSLGLPPSYRLYYLHGHDSGSNSGKVTTEVISVISEFDDNEPLNEY